MQPTTQFSGLTMPVFTAFGWAGEETALKFALSQLELFIGDLHRTLPRAIQERLPYHGLNQEGQFVYLAASEKIEDDLFIAFFARPMSLEIQLTILNKSALDKAYQQAEKEPALSHRLITEPGPEWTLRVQQMQIDEDSRQAAHYQDLFKDSVAALDEEKSVAMMSKAAYLNSDERWVMPFYLSRRIPSERIAAMGLAVVQVIGGQVGEMIPIVDFLTGRTGKKKAKPKPKAKTAVAAPELAPLPLPDESGESFTYVANLKPLHIRRGFINLTAKHWPFFQVNSRTETRPVTVYYEGIYDKECAVWRLLPDDQARLVLSPAVHEWLEDNYASQDHIHITARKIGDDEIQISLRAVDDNSD
jgi:hypothetical protein